MDELNSHTKQATHPLRTRLSLPELINSAARLYTPILERKGATLAIRVPGDLPDVYACAGEITQVLFNLLQNTRNHIEKGGAAITVTAGDRFISVVVSDTGSGIAPELLPRVFERNVSGDDNSSGLGLSICKEIIEAHGGTIEIESVPVKGTIVRFTLPVWREGMLNEHAYSFIG